MADDIERELRDLGADRPLPQPLYERLEAALLDDAALFDNLDAPRPIPPATFAAIERELTGRATRPPLTDRRSRVLLGVAAAVLLVVGSVAALRAGQTDSGRNIAAGPNRTVPEAGAPPLLRLPTPASSEPLPAIAGEKPTAPPTTRRPTTTTTWDCGLCARNGVAMASGSQAGAAGASGAASPGASEPSGAAAVAGARLASYIETISPSSGPRRGGTIVTITGYGFTGASGVLFGTTSVTNWTVVSDTEIRVITPSSPRRESVTVNVAFPDGSTTATQGSSPPAFTYT
jgi:hypothetical protein